MSYQLTKNDRECLGRSVFVSWPEMFCFDTEIPYSKETDNLRTFWQVIFVSVNCLLRLNACRSLFFTGIAIYIIKCPKMIHSGV